MSLFSYGTATMSGKKDGDIEISSIFGFTFPIDEKVLGTMAQTIADDLRLSPSQPGNEVTRRAMSYYMGPENGAEAYTNYVSSG